MQNSDRPKPTLNKLMDQEHMKPGADAGLEPETMLCPACLAENDPSANFCVKCDAPLSATAVLGPFEQTRAQRFIYHRAATEPGSPFVVIGVWGIFGSMALCSAYLLASLGTVVGEPAQLWLEALMYLFTGSFSAAIVWRTTVRYRRRRRTAAQSGLKTRE